MQAAAKPMPCAQGLRLPVPLRCWAHLLLREAEHGAELVQRQAAVEGAVREEVRAQRLALQLLPQDRQHLPGAPAEQCQDLMGKYGV